MSSTETTYTTHRHESHSHVKTLDRGKDIQLDCWAAGFRCVVVAS